MKLKQCISLSMIIPLICIITNHMQVMYFEQTLLEQSSDHSIIQGMIKPILDMSINSTDDGAKKH